MPSSHGRRCRRQSQRAFSDLIVLDIGLPGISGVEAAYQILKVSPRSKIIFLSQHDSIQMVEEAMKVGGHAPLLLQSRPEMSHTNRPLVSSLVLTLAILLSGCKKPPEPKPEPKPVPERVPEKPKGRVISTYEVAPCLGRESPTTWQVIETAGGGAKV